MKKSLLFSLHLLFFAPALLAQDDIPLLLPEERQAVDRQTADFNNAITPALEDAAKSTVRVWSGRRRLAYGTVVGDGSQIVTKWSEIARADGPLVIDAGRSERRSVKLAGVYEDEDIVVLDITGEPLTPVKWTYEQPKLGSFLAATRPDGRLAAFGVVSVPERNLRSTDLAYLGVYAEKGFEGPGVRVESVAEKSGAYAAGLKPGDVILKIGKRPITGFLALRNSLSGIAPGTRIPILLDANGKTRELEVLLGNRPKIDEFFGQRLQIMERMGGPISQVRDSFSRVIQTDMRPAPSQIGGPVVDLSGHAIGITMARADRTRSFVMPAAALDELLKSKSKDPAIAQVRQIEREQPLASNRRMMPAPRQRRQDPERQRRHLSDMQRLTDYMDAELEALDQRP